MKKLLAVLALLPLSAMAQDTLYVKGGTKYPVSITKVENKRVYYALNGKESFMPEENLDRYYWASKPAEPAKKDNLIIIETTDSPEEAFVKVGRLFADAGFPIASSNKDFGTITSGETPGKGMMDGVSLNATIKPTPKTTITIYGSYNAMDLNLGYGMSSDSKGIIEYRGMKGSPLMKVWEEMDKVAKAYPNGSVTYGKR